MKKWMQKLVSQFDPEASTPHMSEDRATILYMIDTINRHLIEIDSSPVRKVREILDDFTKELLNCPPEKTERTLFRFRQYFASYRIEEYSYIQKTFDDFRGIIWDFVDQLAQDFSDERKEDQTMKESMEELKEAVEANSIDSLKSQARLFIDNYIEIQSKKEKRRTQRVDHIKKNLDAVKQKLHEANESINFDHLTKAHNRRSFDETIKKQRNLFEISKKPVSLLMLDIDHFKKINDNYGHDIGDFVLQECVKALKEVFHKSLDFVARIGGEEFAILLPETSIGPAKTRAEEALKKIRESAFVQNNHTVRFTISMGLAQLQANETVEQWMKRADAALYESKNNGRNKLTVSGLNSVKEEVA